LEAAKDYPVVFAKTEDDQVSLLAILGIRNGQNLFVSEDGKWEDDRYIPAFFRRYPFIVTELPGAAEGQLSVCVDSGYEGFDAEEGMQLFDEEGNQTEDMKRAVQFLTDFQNQHQRTRAMIKLLQEYDLFKDVSANITLPGGEKIGFGNLMMVDEEKMLKLDDEKILALVRSGGLAWIYAHLVSISNFRDLMNHAAKQPGAPAEGGQEPSDGPTFSDLADEGEKADEGKEDTGNNKKKKLAPSLTSISKESTKPPSCESGRGLFLYPSVQSGGRPDPLNPKGRPPHAPF
jgi:hypothetical protein